MSDADDGGPKQVDSPNYYREGSWYDWPLEVFDCDSRRET